MLRARSLTLPEAGWGRIDVTEADINVDEPGEPKTGPRSVPIPRILVELLERWVEDNAHAGEDLLFRTRTGTRPGTQNWNRAWKRATNRVGLPPLRVYDCRHAAATTWLRARVPLGETARRLGHSVETLVSTDVGALDGDEEIGNARIDAALKLRRRSWPPWQGHRYAGTRLTSVRLESPARASLVTCGNAPNSLVNGTSGVTW